MSTNQWVLAVTVAVVVIAFVVAVVWGWKKKAVLGPVLVAGVPLVIGIVVNAIIGWPVIGETGGPVATPSPSASAPPAQLDKPDIGVHDPGTALPMCAVVTGTLHQVDGYSPAIGIRESGNDATWYETDVDVSADRKTYTVHVEVGDKEDDSTATYKIVAVMVPTEHLKDLVEATKLATNDDDATYFGAKGAPVGSIVGESLKVTRTNKKPCT